MPPVPSKADLEKKLRKVEKDADSWKQKLIQKEVEFSEMDKKHTALEEQYADLDKDYNDVKKALDQLREETPVITQEKLDELVEDLRVTKQELLKNKLAHALPADVHALQKDLNDTKVDLLEQNQRANELEEENEQLKKQLEAWEMAGRSGKRNMKERIKAIGSDDLYPVKETINNHVTRVIIFLENDSDLAEALQICYKKCPSSIQEKYEETEFMALFGDLLRKTLSDWKNQVQGKAKDAAQCKCLYFANGTLFVYLRDANFTICPIAQFF
jgi:chromosome segregation ATPase